MLASIWPCDSQSGICVISGASANIFSGVTSSLRIEFLFSYFDGNLHTIYFTLIKAAIIHNWKTFS